MKIGILQAELGIPHAESLKDKRAVVRSLKDRLHRDFNVSVAEVGMLDRAEVAHIAVVLVSGSSEHLHEVLNTVQRVLSTHPEARLLEHQREIVSPADVDVQTIPARGAGPRG